MHGCIGRERIGHSFSVTFFSNGFRDFHSFLRGDCREGDVGETKGNWSLSCELMIRLFICLWCIATNESTLASLRKALLFYTIIAYFLWGLAFDPTLGTSILSGGGRRCRSLGKSHGIV